MIYRSGELEVDLGLYELRRAGERVAVEPQVFDLLAYLVEQNARVVTKDELMDHLWPGKFISEAALNSRLMAARKAIGDSGQEQRMIRTLPRRGYRFIAPVEAVEEEPREDEQGRPVRTDVEQRIGFCTTADGVRIAYARSGDGPPLVKAANWLSHLEFDWRSPVWRHWMEELSSRRMLVRYDERGCGLSDWECEDLGFEAWVRDLEAVVDHLGLERFPLLGISQGGAVAIAYAVRHPERVSGLVLYGSYATGAEARGASAEERREREAMLTLTRAGWGRDHPAYRQIFASYFIPGANAGQMRWFDDLCRTSTSPTNAVRFIQEFARVDVDDLLERVEAPTLVIHAREDMRVPFEEGRKLASRIRGARFVPLASANHILLEDEPAWEVFRAEVRSFLDG